MKSWEEFKKSLQQQADLWEAAEANDLYRIRYLLARGSYVNEADSRGSTPLMRAVKAGRREATELLLTMGADPNSTDLTGTTVLMAAHVRKDAGLIEVLVKRGATHRPRSRTILTAVRSWAKRLTVGRAQNSNHRFSRKR